MITNPVKQALQEGRVVLGGCAFTMRNPAVSRIFASCGFQFIYIDMEHSPVTMETVADIVLVARCCGIVPLVGPTAIEPYMISRALDAGALGVIVPHVETREEVELIIKAAKYPPFGERGLAGRGAHLDYGPMGPAVDMVANHNAETMVVLKVESREAIDRLDELISVPGVDGAFVGPGDLSQSLGMPGQSSHPLVVEYIHKVIEKCRNHGGVAPGLHVGSVAMAKEWIDKGMQLLAYSTELGILQDAASSIIWEINAHLGG